jgi:hypothetical protein
VRFFPDSLIARSSAYQTLLPQPWVVQYLQAETTGLLTILRHPGDYPFHRERRPLWSSEVSVVGPAPLAVTSIRGPQQYLEKRHNKSRLLTFVNRVLPLTLTGSTAKIITWTMMHTRVACLTQR